MVMGMFNPALNQPIQDQRQPLNTQPMAPGQAPLNINPGLIERIRAFITPNVGPQKEPLNVGAPQMDAPMSMFSAGNEGTFSDLSGTYDLKRATKLIEENRLRPVVVPEDVYSQERIDEISSVGKLEGGREVDLNIPGIVVVSKRSDGLKGFRIVDGWNRAAKARKEGKPFLAYPVPKEEILQRG